MSLCSACGRQFNPVAWCPLHPFAPAKDDAIPAPISPEVDDGCNGPTSLVRQQLIDALGDELGEDAPAWWAAVADRLLRDFVIMKRIKGDDNEQRADRAENKLRRIGEVVKTSGCDCDCEHHRDECSDECQRCTGCLIDTILRES